MHAYIGSGLGVGDLSWFRRPRARLAALALGSGHAATEPRPIRYVLSFAYMAKPNVDTEKREHHHRSVERVQRLLIAMIAGTQASV